MTAGATFASLLLVFWTQESSFWQQTAMFIVNMCVFTKPLQFNCCSYELYMIVLSSFTNPDVISNTKKWCSCCYLSWLKGFKRDKRHHKRNAYALIQVIWCFIDRFGSYKAIMYMFRKLSISFCVQQKPENTLWVNDDMFLHF